MLLTPEVYRALGRLTRLSSLDLRHRLFWEPLMLELNPNRDGLEGTGDSWAPSRPKVRKAARCASKQQQVQVIVPCVPPAELVQLVQHLPRLRKLNVTSDTLPAKAVAVLEQQCPGVNITGSTVLVTKAGACVAGTSAKPTAKPSTSHKQPDDYGLEDTLCLM
jgi:hypothetical protein